VRPSLAAVIQWGGARTSTGLSSPIAFALKGPRIAIRYTCRATGAFGVCKASSVDMMFMVGVCQTIKER
jgi:hypothetical protein